MGRPPRQARLDLAASRRTLRRYSRHCRPISQERHVEVGARFEIQGLAQYCLTTIVSDDNSTHGGSVAT